MAFEDFKRTLESVHAAIAITDAKGAITFANPAFADLAGRFRAELEGSAFASLFAPDARKRIEQNVARVGEGKVGSAFVDAALATQGEDTRWVQIAQLFKAPSPFREKKACPLQKFPLENIKLIAPLGM